MQKSTPVPYILEHLAMSEETTLSWTYSPTGYFENIFKYTGDGFTLVIDRGKATATIVAELGNSAKVDLETIHEEVQALFLGAQMENHEKFTLSRPQITNARADGSRNVSGERTERLNVTEQAIAILRDTQGETITDTRAETHARQRECALLSAKHRNDPIAAAILRSYNSAVEAPANELTRLYEIRDALAKKFGGKKGNRARRTLALNPGWKRFEDLANNKPLRQGRHSGLHADQLRDATHAELAEARTIARDMILSYLRHLETRS